MAAVPHVPPDHRPSGHNALTPPEPVPTSRDRVAFGRVAFGRVALGPVALLTGWSRGA